MNVKLNEYIDHTALKSAVTENEIKTKILAFAYGHLNDKEKRIFFYDILETNCILQ